MPSAASITITSRPPSANARATARPTTPAPITTQSTRSISELPRIGLRQQFHHRAQIAPHFCEVRRGLQRGLVHIELAVDFDLDAVTMRGRIAIAPHQLHALV